MSINIEGTLDRTYKSSYHAEIGRSYVIVCSAIRDNLEVLCDLGIRIRSEHGSADATINLSPAQMRALANDMLAHAARAEALQREAYALHAHLAATEPVQVAA